MTARSDIAQLVRERREEILRIAAKHGAHNVRVFGSVARGEARPDSDLDLLVDLELGRSLLDQGGLLMDLQELLGLRVDVFMPRRLHAATSSCRDVFMPQGLRPRVRERAIHEAVPL